MTISTKAIFNASLAAFIAFMPISTNAYAEEKPRPPFTKEFRSKAELNSVSNAGTKKNEEVLKQEELKQEELRQAAKKLPQ